MLEIFILENIQQSTKLILFFKMKSQKIKSLFKKIDPRFPLVKNIMIFQNIYIEFETSFYLN